MVGAEQGTAALNYILGLDLGTNSVGWALLACDKDGEPIGLLETPEGLLPMGVRVFEEGLANFDSSKEKSLAQDRRQARSMRRVLSRRAERKRKVKGALIRAGLLPADVSEVHPLMHTDPYQLRAEALDLALTHHEFGRVLLHLAQRRGFKSNRKSGQSEGDTIKAMNALQADIESTGSRTLGEFLFKHKSEAERAELLPRGEAGIRGRHTRRDMYEAEFDAIWDAQAKHHDMLTSELRDTIHTTIFKQLSYLVTPERREASPSRANMRRAPEARICPFFFKEGLRVCPRGEWIAQRFRILKEVNNLRIISRHGADSDPSTEEREHIIDLLSKSKEVKFDTLRKELHKKFKRDPEVEFNLERGKRTKLLGNAVDDELARRIGRKVWDKLADERKQELRVALNDVEDPQEMKQAFAEFDLDEGDILRLVSFSGPAGYMGYSKRALEFMVPYLESGLNEYEAIEAAVKAGELPRHQSGEEALLPSLIDRSLPQELSSITNPVVRRALVEMRKVVNAIVRELGRPEKIVVELARELKMGSEDRKEFNQEMRKREATREKAREAIKKLGIPEPSRDDIIRFLIWKEQLGRCIYSDRAIPQEVLFSGDVDVDHILPRWLSLDDSQNNKVLAYRSLNNEKGNRTPAQWLGSESERFQQLEQRAYKMTRFSEHTDGYPPMPWPKFLRLKKRDVDSEGFVQRQLNDTRYIARLAVQYLNLLFPAAERSGEKRVSATPGGMTAELRYHWGLNAILKNLWKQQDDDDHTKSRNDHRHHAIDACVVALTTRKHIKAFQDHIQKVHNRERLTRDPGAYMDEGRFPEPWEAFWGGLKDVVERINVSHKPMRKLSGAFHEGTYYGPLKSPEDQKSGRVVYRVALSSLTGKQVNAIRDKVVKSVVIKRLLDLGWDGEDNKLPKDWHVEPLHLPDGMPVRKVRITTTQKNVIAFTRDESEAPFKVAPLGNNHHVEVLRDPKEPDPAKALRFSVVPALEAANRVRRHKQSMIKRDHEGLEFVMSLSRKEAVLARDPQTGQDVLCVVTEMSGTGNSIDVVFRDARDSRKSRQDVEDDSGRKKKVKTKPFARVSSVPKWASLSIRKVQIDPLGRISPDRS